MLAKIAASLNVPPLAPSPRSAVMLLTTCVTPWVLRAIRSASDFSAAVVTAPLKVTTPFEVSTLILAALVVGSAASLFFTAVVTVASLVERLSQPVKDMTSAATIVMNESFIFYTPLYCSLTQRLAPIRSNHDHSHGFRRDRRHKCNVNAM
jgi:hypothetical protein